MTGWQLGDSLPKEFVHLVYDIYQHDKCWIPEQSNNLALAFSTVNDFFEQGEAYIDVIPDACRLAGFLHPALQIDGKKAAFFGYWESKNTLAENKRLFTDFERWAKLGGAQVVYGPINFNTFNQYRIKLSGFDTPAFPSEPHNPDYYEHLLQSLGYQLHIRYGTFIADAKPECFDFMIRNQTRLQSRLSKKFNLYALNETRWRALNDQLYEQVDCIFGDNFAYTPISRNLYDHAVIDNLAKKICDKTSLAVLDKNTGQLCGVHINFPDYSDLLCQQSQMNINTAQIDYAQHFSKLENPCALFKISAINPKFRLNGLMYQWLATESLSRICKLYDKVAFCIVRVGGNTHRMLQKVPIHSSRHYGLFCKELE